MFEHESQVEKKPSASQIHQRECLANLWIDLLLWYVYIVGSCLFHKIGTLWILGLKLQSELSGRDIPDLVSTRRKTFS